MRQRLRGPLQGPTFRALQAPVRHYPKDRARTRTQDAARAISGPARAYSGARGGRRPGQATGREQSASILPDGAASGCRGTRCERACQLKSPSPCFPPDPGSVEKGRHDRRPAHSDNHVRQHVEDEVGCSLQHEMSLPAAPLHTHISNKCLRPEDGSVPPYTAPGRLHPGKAGNK